MHSARNRWQRIIEDPIRSRPTCLPTSRWQAAQNRRPHGVQSQLKLNDWAMHRKVPRGTGKVWDDGKSLCHLRWASSWWLLLLTGQPSTSTSTKLNLQLPSVVSCILHLYGLIHGHLWLYELSLTIARVAMAMTWWCCCPLFAETPSITTTLWRMWGQETAGEMVCVYWFTPPVLLCSKRFITRITWYEAPRPQKNNPRQFSLQLQAETP